MADDPKSEPRFSFAPDPDAPFPGEDRPPPPDPEPGINLQGDTYRPMSYDIRRKAAPFAWRPFLLWLGVGVTVLWAFVFAVVGLVLYFFGQGGTNVAVPGGLAFVLCFLGWYFARKALRSADAHGARPRPRPATEPFDDQPKL